VTGSLYNRRTRLSVQAPSFRCEAALAPMPAIASLTRVRRYADMFAITRGAGSLLFSACIILSLPLFAVAQNRSLPDQGPKAPELSDIAISPSRIELPMLPGTEKTLVVNLIYSSDTGAGQPTRVIAYLGDWTITKAGKLDFFPAGSRSNSASPWLVYSPGEVTVMPGRTHPIRVTISVPKDAAPGEHITALFVEPRADEIKFEQNRKHVQVKFRLAAVFYVMVPTLTQDGSLENLRAEASEKSLIVTPTLKNKGNTHVRPIYSIKVVDQRGGTVAECSETETLPVLAASETEFPLLIEKGLPAGSYSVQYRVKFTENGPVTEGRAEFVVAEPSARKAVIPAAAVSQKAKADGHADR
jgi:hypothetical protein